jgi:hypothetical protein
LGAPLFVFGGKEREERLNAEKLRVQSRSREETRMGLAGRMPALPSRII